jgi:LCP family protein required for cell wall assembly
VVAANPGNEEGTVSAQETSRVRHATQVKRHPVVHGLIWAFAAALGFAIVFTQTAVQQVEARIETHNVSPLLGDDRPAPALPPDDAAKGRALNILLMGSDDRSGENAAIGGKEAGQRNDTTIIMHISADRSRVELLSIPRDSMVRLAQCERSDGSTQKSYTGMFNEAFANGGKFGSKSDAAACTMRTVESLTNIRIDHWAVVDFVGFQAMVDAIGGVPMCIPKAVKDKYSGLDLPAGPQVLDGTEALQYARARHGTGFSGSDLDRIDRQQILLKNLARKVVGAEVLFNPKDLFGFISAAAQTVTMDEQLGNIDGYSVGLGLSLRNLNTKTGIVMATVPVKGYAPDPNRVEFSAAAAPIFAAMASDQPIAPLLDKTSASPANDPEAGQEPSTPASPGTDGGTGTEPPRETEEEILASCAS